MPTTQTVKEHDSAVTQQVVALSTRYVAALLGQTFDLDIESVNLAIVSDVSVIIRALSQHGTSGEIPEILVVEAMQQQSASRINIWRTRQADYKDD